MVGSKVKEGKPSKRSPVPPSPVSTSKEAAGAVGGEAAAAALDRPGLGRPCCACSPCPASSHELAECKLHSSKRKMSTTSVQESMPMSESTAGSTCGEINS